MLSPADARRTAPATARNREPILGVLRRVLPPSGLVLEIASGTGEHAAHFAAALAHLEWQPSDCDPEARASIDAHAAAAGLANLRPAIALDAAAATWPIARADAILCINMLHIAPWEATLGLMAGTARILPPDGVLYLYGPYRVGGGDTAPSNAAFDRSLRARDPRWGVRDLEAVTALAQEHGLALVERVPMPAHNLSLVLRRRAPVAASTPSS